MNRSNRLALSGRLSERDALRHTPAGVALVSFRLAHESTQQEAGAARQVNLEIACVAAEELARVIGGAPLGTTMAVAGFLAPKGRANRQLVLHLTELEFLEGD